MAPMAIQPVSELVINGQKHTVGRTAPSIAANGHSGHLQELDASHLIFTRNAAPKAVPEPNSPEIRAQNM